LGRLPYAVSRPSDTQTVRSVTPAAHSVADIYAGWTPKHTFAATATSTRTTLKGRDSGPEPQKEEIMTKKQERENDREDSARDLRKLLKPGATVYHVMRSVSRSGMRREIVSYAIVDDRMQYLSGYMARVLDMRRGKRDGLIVNGCGMDMGFHLVNNLSYALYKDGHGCTGDYCPSNEHSNGDRSRAKHSKRHPHWHHTSGFALRSEWL
jgi:hypothetical protein